MYRITRTDGVVLGIVEKVNYIKISENGSFTPAEQSDAVGVAYLGTAYNLAEKADIPNADAVVVTEIDGGLAAMALGVLFGDIDVTELSRMAEQFRMAVQMYAETLDDEQAISVEGIYEAWSPGTACREGMHIRYGGRLYRILQAHTAQADWPPDKTPSLYTCLNPDRAGTLEDPIPYDGNMLLERGKYYTQGGVLYLCIRDTGIPVYAALSDLIGLYVEEVREA